MKSKYIVILSLILGIISILLFLYIFHDASTSHKSYLEAEKYAINYLNSNSEQLTKTAKDVIESKPSKPFNNKLKGIDYISYGDGAIHINEDYATFKFKDTGFVHDVAWGLIYAPSNKYEGEDSLYINQNSTHNDIFIRKKIKDNWYFYYDDFDGTTDLNDVKK